MMPKTTKLYIFIIILGFNLTDEVCGNSCESDSIFDVLNNSDYFKSLKGDPQRMYGYTCKYNSDCKTNSNARYSFSMSNDLECKNGRCNCTLGVCYNSDVSRFECKQHTLTNMWGGRGGADCEKEECGPNSICVKGKKNIIEDIDDYKCVCNDGYLEVSKECREVHHVSAGEVCSTPKTGPLQFCDINRNKSCIKGKCTCIRDHYNDPDIDACISKEDYIEKFKANLIVGFSERCTTKFDGLPRYCDEAAHMTCISEKCLCHKDYYNDPNIISCISKEDYIEKYKTVGLFETCTTTNSVRLPFFCNEAANMTCVSEKCQCLTDFYYDTRRTIGPSLTCKSKASFTAEHNLTKYRVMPGEYCHTNKDCIDGITCHNYNCSCPYPCEYNHTITACDCGEVSATEGAAAAILVGIIGGIIIIAGWWYFIKIQIRNAKGGENYTAASTEGDTNCRNSSPASYPLRPISNTNHTAVPTHEPSSSHQADSQSPSSAPALPHKHTPSDSASPFNPPDALPSYPSSMSQPPPPYNPQAAPPYTPPTYQQPTAPPTGITAPLIYQAPSNPNEPYPDYPSAKSHLGAYYPGAPYTAEPYSSAPPYYGASSQPDAPYPGESGGTSSGIPSEPPPAYTPPAKPFDIYKPII